MNRSYASSIATALVAVVTLAISGYGWAEGMEKGMNETSESHALPQKQQQAFSKLDTNKDGKIDQNEAKQDANLSNQFSKADSNQDNAIDEGEFARFETENEHD